MRAWHVGRRPGLGGFIPKYETFGEFSNSPLGVFIRINTAWQGGSALARHRRRAGPRRPPGDLRAEPDERVVLAARHALLHRDDRVIGDLDVLGADLGAALGDVAVPEAELVLRDVPAVRLVGGVHLKLRDAHEEPGPGERGLVLRVVPDHVAGVLAEVALDALAELLRPVHVLLHLSLIH